MPLKNTMLIPLLFLGRPKKLSEALPNLLIQMVHGVEHYLFSVIHCLIISSCSYSTAVSSFMIVGLYPNNLTSGREMVINVEYNQLDPLLRATGHPDGDVNCETGYSPYPGNINQV